MVWTSSRRPHHPHYRIVQDAINAAAFGIGPPIQMIEIPVETGQAGEARKLTDDELRILDEKVLEWKLAESEILTRFVGLTPSEDASSSAGGTGEGTA